MLIASTPRRPRRTLAVRDGCRGFDEVPLARRGLTGPRLVHETAQLCPDSGGVQIPDRGQECLDDMTRLIEMIDADHGGSLPDREAGAGVAVVWECGLALEFDGEEVGGLLETSEAEHA
ncbi:hypothetical protein [Amycolatopsis sp. H20-H5]|uniref:hypothetical protein n=1 Tax=Amycolatopsis sp. H20-H5 TaxID=3046309 RepID=UPI002DBC4BF2|nr:hypothetical protein [Amycolatopsis sp. H20-H5]MEC3982828.1 hypothetical protein [Amycolatopsis sp. H20-H5]